MKYGDVDVKGEFYIRLSEALPNNLCPFGDKKYKPTFKEDVMCADMAYSVFININKDKQLNCILTKAYPVELDDGFDSVMQQCFGRYINNLEYLEYYI
jgi:hypothetical protein